MTLAFWITTLLKKARIFARLASMVARWRSFPERTGMTIRIALSLGRWSVVKCQFSRFLFWMVLMLSEIYNSGWPQ